MKISILSSEIGIISSGQSRFTINLAKGLRELGVDVSVYCAYASDETVTSLQRDGISIEPLGLNTSSRLYKALLLTRFNNVGKKVAALSLSRASSDWYVVLSDELIGAVSELSDVRTVHISNGNLALLFLNPNLFRGTPLLFHLLSLGMASRLREGSRFAKLYDVMLGNSRFTCGFMSYVYGRPFDGILYPPVNTRVFRKTSEVKGKYCLVLARNSSEQNLEIVRLLAREIPIRVVGGARIQGCESLGKVSDAALASLYAAARVVLYPTVSEFFGYAVAEALCCGTPVITFANGGGPSEMIQNGVNGWLCSRVSDFVEQSRTVYNGAYLDLDPKSIVNSAAGYSMEAVARNLLMMLRVSATGE